jgi:hypothetical protein
MSYVTHNPIWLEIGDPMKGVHPPVAAKEVEGQLLKLEVFETGSVALARDHRAVGHPSVITLVRYTPFNDCSDPCTTGAQPALSLRLGPQIQAVLSREGRTAGGCGTGQSRGRSGGSAGRGACAGSHAGTKAPDAPALEGDQFSRLRPADADATQGRRQLSTFTPAINVRLDCGASRRRARRRAKARNDVRSRSRWPGLTLNT